MDDREAIEAILDKAYAARQKQDIEGVIGCFCPDGRFQMNGSEGLTADRTGQRSALAGLFAAFELLDFKMHCRVIDPPRAVVHWRGKFRARGSGQIADTDILDLIEIKDGQIASLTTFFDTALAARIAA